jgi:hypothetical protein
MRIPTRRVVASLMVMMAIAMSGLPGAPSPVRAAGSITALAIDSEPGDNVGQGQQLEYAPPTATFSVATFSSGWTFLQVLGAQGGDFWNLSFAAADSGTLTVGTYENAQRSADALHPGLDVGGQGRGCNTATGRFVISEIERDLNGNVTTLALAFEQHCEGGPAALFGEVRYQASTGYELLSVAPTSVDLGSAGIGTATLAQTVHLTSIGTVGLAISGLSIDGTNAADFAIVSETCPDGVLAPAASCEVTVKATPTASGERTGRLVVDNDTFRGRRTVGLTATGITPVSAVAWGTTRSGPNYSFNLGQSLVRSVSGTTTYLHATYTTDRVSGTWVDDNGPYAGVYHVRTSNRGSTFSTPKRLNPSTQHGSRGSLASSGRYLYATWISTSRWIAYRGTAPRVLYLRRNSNHGARSYWNTTKRLTSLSGRVDYPTVAAAGSNVYVVYTDSGTGAIKLKISRDRAATWRTVTLGSTAWSTTSGRYGIPRIAASGNTVVVSWLSDSDGAIRARVSTDAGATWSAIGALTGTSTDIPAVAALGSRAAVAWTDGSSAVVRTWTAGAWSAPKSTGTPTGAGYTQTYGPAIALSGSAGMGVAWTGCVTPCESWTSATRADLIWSESKDGGASWFAGQVIGSSATSSARRYNDYPSILWPSATVRHVLWNAGTAGTNYYRIVLRTGTGVVAAPSATAATGTNATSTDGDRAAPATPMRSPGGP